MRSKISVVINTLNEEENIKRAIDSVATIADEIVLCDMYSTDKTVEIAKKLGAKIFYHKNIGFVEPARNFAVSKAEGDWVLVLDADEEISAKLSEHLKKIVELNNCDFVNIPRKNIIFGKWMHASMWWPDPLIRFFRKGTVIWSDEIHRPPTTKGVEFNLPFEQDLAITHYNYKSISEFLLRMDRYSTIQAEEIFDKGEKFNWRDLVTKPLNEFLSRFFAHRGFEDGVHGLALALLQSFSFLIVYLKLWELEKFKEEKLAVKEVEDLAKKSGKEINYWFRYIDLSSNPLLAALQKAKNKLTS